MLDEEDYMENNIDYSVSNITEKNPIGYIKFLYSGEIVEFYSEESLLKEFKNTIYSEGVNSVNYGIYTTKNNKRHGLKYEIIREVSNEYGKNYSKADYEKMIKEMQEKN